MFEGILMKKLMVVLALTAPSVAMACGELSDYEVIKVNFARTPVKQAVSKVTEGMPFQIIFNGDTDNLVSANDVSGPLDQVLSLLTKQLGMNYTKDRCVLTFTPKVDTSLVIKSGDIISERLITWAKRYNYTLVWEADEYRATAPLSIDKGFNETIDAVVDAMTINGVFLEPTTYENRVIRLMEKK